MNNLRNFCVIMLTDKYELKPLLRQSVAKVIMVTAYDNRPPVFQSSIILMYPKSTQQWLNNVKS